MKKTISMIFFVCVGFFYSDAQKGKIITSLKKLYSSYASHSDYIFIADTTIDYFPFKIHDFIGSIDTKDTTLIKEILLKGKKNYFRISNLKKWFPEAKYISFDLFEKLAPPAISLSKSETEVLDSISLVGQMRTQELLEKDSARYMDLYRIERNLFHSKYFSTYWKKAERVEKRLLLLYPVFTYNNASLLLLVDYKNKMNSNFIVKLIKPD